MQAIPELKFEIDVYVDNKINLLKISYPLKNMTPYQHQQIIKLTNNFFHQLTGENKSVEEASKEVAAVLSVAGKSI